MKKALEFQLKKGDDPSVLIKFFLGGHICYKLNSEPSVIAKKSITVYKKRIFRTTF